ncbi:MAG: murein hydrolase activator EnvC family protein [Clostridia bacterium]
MLKRKSRFAMIVAILLMLTFAVETSLASAATLSQIRNNIKNKQQELNESRAKEKSLGDQVNSLEQQINSKQSDIDELEASISEAQAKLETLEEELAAAEEKVNTQNENLNARLRNMYKNGSVGFIDVLMDSGSFSEFLNNLSLVEKVYTSDQDVLEALQKAYDEIDAKKKEIETLQAELSESKATMEEQKSSLEADKASVEKKKSEIAADSAETQRELDKLEADAQALTSSIRNSGSSSSSSKYNGGIMAWPVPSCHTVSSGYGGRIHPTTGKYKFHGGLDIPGSYGSAIVAANSGKVIWAGNRGDSYGNYVIIDHGGGVSTLYGHSSKVLVRTGQSVSRGQRIANVGSTGRSTGPHCHFEVRINGSRVNPNPYVN